MTALHDAVASYKARGWEVVLVETRGKDAFEKRWPHKNPNPENFGATNNVGVKGGPKSGNLVDLDLDWPESRRMAALPILFGDCPAFGREGHEYPGHRLVVVPDLLSENAKVYKCVPNKTKEANKGKLCVMEVRASSSHMTVFPPSEHEAKIVWTNGEAPGNVPDMEWDEVVKRAWLVAFLAIALRHYPGEGGRDDYMMAVGGVLARAGVDSEMGVELIRGLCEAAGDTSEIDMRVTKCRQAQARIDAGETATALTRLLDEEHFTKDEVKALGLFLRASDKSDKVSSASVDVSDPDLANFSRVLQSRIIDANPNLVFRRGARLVHVRTLDEDELENDNQVLVRAGTVIISHANKAWLALAASEAGVQFHKVNARGTTHLCRPDGMDVLLSSPEDTKFLTLSGISTTPTLERDVPGYCTASHMMLVFKEGYFPPAPKMPTPEMAKAALDRIKWPLREFPFEGPGHRSVLLSAIISAVIRDEMLTCPIHLFDAPLAGTGKTMCADIVSIIATGIMANNITYTPNSEEMEKRLFAMLLRGTRTINLDNVSSTLSGDFLCAMLTSPKKDGRLLGESEMMSLSTSVLVMATGNNMVVKGDMVRRAVTCRLNAGCEAPDLRKFDFDPIEEVTKTRAQMVVDCLTIIRAYRLDGRPDRPSHVGGFTAWTEVRGALMWLGEDDPAITQQENRESDPDVESRAQILGAIWDWLDGQKATFTVAEMGGPRGEKLRDVISDHLAKGVWGANAVGWLLRRHMGVPCGDLTLRSKKVEGRRQYWIERALPETLI